MTVKELYEACKSYMDNGCQMTNHHLACSMCPPEQECGKEERGNHQVLIRCDDLWPTFFSPSEVGGTTFSKEVAPAKIEKKRTRVKVKLADIRTYERNGWQVPKMACYHECDKCELHGECIETVGQWRDNVPVEVEPAKYADMPVLMLKTSSAKREKGRENAEER